MRGADSGAGACAAVAQAVTGQYLSSIMTALLIVDVTGTAQVLFRVTKQFEIAVLTTGKDITVLLQVPPPRHAAVHPATAPPAARLVSCMCTARAIGARELPRRQACWPHDCSEGSGEVHPHAHASSVQGLGMKRGLGGLFKRVGNLSKGVLVGQLVGLAWMLRGLVLSGAPQLAAKLAYGAA